MHPWSHPEFLRRFQLGVKTKHWVWISVAPASNEKHRALNALISRTHGTIAPVGTVDLMLHPFQQIGLVVFKAMLPKLRPPGSSQFRQRRQRIHRNHPTSVAGDVVVQTHVSTGSVVAI